MYKIKRYLDCYIPITTCNLRCSYCYVAQKKLFKVQATKLPHSPQEIRKALSKKRMGGTCAIGLGATGETLLIPETIDIARELLEEGHFVMIVTNGTLTNRFDQIATLPKELLKHLFFKFSFHYLELKRLSAFDEFFSNVKKMKQVGCSFTVELTPCDEEIPYIDDIKKKCVDNLGALCHITIGRSDIDPEHRIPHLSELSFPKYKKIWGQFDSDLFDFKKGLFYQKRDEFCYAGLWSASINLGEGNISQCLCGKSLGNIFENIDKPIKFEPVGKNCRLAHCFNGHVYLAFGCIPSINSYTYCDVRNRVCADGTEWLQPDYKELFSSKLIESNKPWSRLRQGVFQMKTNIKTLTFKENIARAFPKLYSRIKANK